MCHASPRHARGVVVHMLAISQLVTTIGIERKICSAIPSRHQESNAGVIGRNQPQLIPTSCPCLGFIWLAMPRPSRFIPALIRVWRTSRNPIAAFWTVAAAEGGGGGGDRKMRVGADIRQRRFSDNTGNQSLLQAKAIMRPLSHRLTFSTLQSKPRVLSG